jgi:hypothetical protein
MRTLFEDTEERANREDDEEGKRLPLYLWLLAVVVLAGAGGTYYWVTHRKPPEPPPVAVSLEDPIQRGQALSRFNSFVRAEKWSEAEGMLSTEALNRLKAEKKTLRESLLGERQNDRVMGADSTASVSVTPSTVRVDCVYTFADNQQKIVPLTLVKENDRLVINSWAAE